MHFAVLSFTPHSCPASTTPPTHPHPGLHTWPSRTSFYSQQPAFRLTATQTPSAGNQARASCSFRATGEGLLSVGCLGEKESKAGFSALFLSPRQSSPSPEALQLHGALPCHAHVVLKWLGQASLPPSTASQIDNNNSELNADIANDWYYVVSLYI